MFIGSAGSRSVPRKYDESRDVISTSRVKIIAVRPPRPERAGYAATISALTRILERLKLTHRGNVDIIVFPELFMGKQNPHSIGANSSLIVSLSAYAKHIHCYMVIPVLDRDEQGALYNSALFMNREGQVFASYR